MTVELRASGTDREGGGKGGSEKKYSSVHPQNVDTPKNGGKIVPEKMGVHHSNSPATVCVDAAT